MRIDILARDEVHNITPELWDGLSESSINTNPFFERWCLSPALKYLDIDEEIFIVVAYKNEKLIALFPLQIRNHYLGLKYLSIWQHSQCFLCEPLCDDREDLYEVLHTVMLKKQLSIIQLPFHTSNSFGQYIEKHSISFTSQRGSVDDFSEIKSHFSNLARKQKSENKRIVNRLFQVTAARYVSSKIEPDRNWLEDYCHIEDSGWKGLQGGSIKSNTNIYLYYKEMCVLATCQNKIEFQGLFNNSETLAISLRIYTKNKGFDLKTSYNEIFKGFYPGVVLEICNLNELSNSKLDYLDSCTASNNRLVNRLWPEQKKIQMSYFFDHGLIGRMLRLLYKIKRWKYSSPVKTD